MIGKVLLQSMVPQFSLLNIPNNEYLNIYEYMPTLIEILIIN